MLRRSRRGSSLLYFSGPASGVVPLYTGRIIAFTSTGTYLIRVTAPFRATFKGCAAGGTSAAGNLAGGGGGGAGGGRDGGGAGSSGGNGVGLFVVGIKL